MNTLTTYPIGSTGKIWGVAEKAAWLNQQKVKRSYHTSVLNEIDKVADNFDVIKYGDLAYAATHYPLFVLKSSNWCNSKSVVLITGGVHGYETSGVHGALRFAEHVSALVREQFNFIIAPCISPWGYETINRWNPDALDPNRSFYANNPVKESSLLMGYIESLAVDISLHVDLHETTDSDNSEFRPALMARDAKTEPYTEIPDGFYLVGDSQKPQSAFQRAIIKKVQCVTHIAPADEQQMLIGSPIAQFGVINYDARALGLCMGLTDAPLVTTTEVYPDSLLVDDENCIAAQVAAIDAAIEYLSTSLNVTNL